jgi:hypothetical protein
MVWTKTMPTDMLKYYVEQKKKPNNNKRSEGKGP